MFHSTHHDRKAKAIAKVSATIAAAHPELAPHRPHHASDTDEWLWENATEFCAVLGRYAERTMQNSAPAPSKHSKPHDAY
jgi:hypothetical protein